MTRSPFPPQGRETVGSSPTGLANWSRLPLLPAGTTLFRSALERVSSWKRNAPKTQTACALFRSALDITSSFRQDMLFATGRWTGSVSKCGGWLRSLLPVVRSETSLCVDPILRCNRKRLYRPDPSTVLQLVDLPLDCFSKAGCYLVSGIAIISGNIGIRFGRTNFCLLILVHGALGNNRHGSFRKLADCIQQDRLQGFDCSEHIARPHLVTFVFRHVRDSLAGCLHPQRSMAVTGRQAGRRRRLACRFLSAYPCGPP